MKTRIFKINPKRIDKKAIREASKILKRGGIVAFPTETVYGLGASLNKTDAIDRLYKIKKRPKPKPFTIHISKKNKIRELDCIVTKTAQRLIDKFWPGPLTLIFRTKTGKKIGLRLPEDKVALALLDMAKDLIVAPSANISGRQAQYCAEGVIKYFNGVVDGILDAGRTALGKESTIVDVSTHTARLIREGVIEKNKLDKYL